jgi:hypothetical protein
LADATPANFSYLITLYHRGHRGIGICRVPRYKAKSVGQTLQMTGAIYAD